MALAVATGAAIGVAVATYLAQKRRPEAQNTSCASSSCWGETTASGTSSCCIGGSSSNDPGCCEDSSSHAGKYWYCPGGCAHSFHDKCHAEAPELRDGTNKVCVPCYTRMMSEGRGGRDRGAKRPRTR